MTPVMFRRIVAAPCWGWPAINHHDRRGFQVMVWSTFLTDVYCSPGLLQTMCEARLGQTKSLDGFGGWVDYQVDCWFSYTVSCSSNPCTWVEDQI